MKFIVITYYKFVYENFNIVYLLWVMVRDLLVFLYNFSVFEDRAMSTGSHKSDIGVFYGHFVVLTKIIKSKIKIFQDV